MQPHIKQSSVILYATDIYSSYLHFVNQRKGNALTAPSKLTTMLYRITAKTDASYRAAPAATGPVSTSSFVSSRMALAGEVGPGWYSGDDMTPKHVRLAPHAAGYFAGRIEARDDFAKLIDDLTFCR